METYLKSFMCADVANLIDEYLRPDYRENYNLAMRSLLWRRSPVFDKLLNGPLEDEYIEVFYPDGIDYECDYYCVVLHLCKLFKGLCDKDGDRPIYMLPHERLYHFTQEYI